VYFVKETFFAGI